MAKLNPLNAAHNLFYCDNLTLVNDLSTLELH